MNDARKPEAVFLPQILKTPSRLVCRFGWDEAVSQAFAKETFHQLILEGGPNDRFDIPDLGPKAGEVKSVSLRCNGIIEGLEQFSALQAIRIESTPKNGIDLTEFTTLESIYVDREPELLDQITRLTQLKALDYEGYPNEVCKEVEALRNVEILGFTQGSIASLDNLLRCPALRSLSLAYIRGLADVDSLNKMTSLENLSIANLPKLKGRLSVGSMGSLRNLYVVDTPMRMDLSGIGELEHLETIWLKTETINLDWEQVLSVTSLRKIGIVDPSAREEDMLALANKIGREVASIKIVGPKRSRQVQVDLG